MLKPGKMGKWKDLSNFDKGHIVMARQLAGLVGFSQYTVVINYQKWFKEGQLEVGSLM